MSNDHNNQEQNEVISLTPTQQSPGTALPSDFVIGSPVQTSPTPGHNQRGKTKAEEAALFREAQAFKPTIPLPTPNKL
jgi:hypothetical protein